MHPARQPETRAASPHPRWAPGGCPAPGRRAAWSGWSRRFRRAQGHRSPRPSSRPAATTAGTRRPRAPRWRPPWRRARSSRRRQRGEGQRSCRPGPDDCGGHGRPV